MGSLKDPKTWIPHINPKDCSQKICNIYCTKWCKYIILPSPPPPLSKDDLGGATLSPVVIVIIALIGSFFLLIAYFVFISRYCSRNINESSVLFSRGVENQETHFPEMGFDGRDQEHNHLNHIPWLVLGKGLDEAVIKSITLCKYKKGDGLVSCTDCSVCLGEFQEDESIRLLPKCSHAFHVYCIDTWLKTHSNCPLCRASVCFEANGTPLVTPPTPPPPPPPPPVTNELGARDVTVEIREEGRMKMIRRSKSMDCLCQTRVSIPRVMFFNQAEEMARQEVQFRCDARSSENVLEGNSKGLNFGTQRSYSSCRYVFTSGQLN